jgi:hypothetical protein
MVNIVTNLNNCIFELLIRFYKLDKMNDIDFMIILINIIE